MTETDLDTMVRLTGDSNPIHCDEEMARDFGQSRRVAHGVFLLGLISQVIGTKLPGPGSIWYGSEMEFVAPVYMGDEIEATASVLHVSRATRVAVLDVTLLRLPDTPVLRGKVKVKLPMRTLRRRGTMKLEGMHAVVTGGTRGIGEAIARRLAADGLKVIVNFKHDEVRAARVVSEIETLGGQARAVKADVAVSSEVRALYDQAVAAFGKVDVVVNNATPTIKRKSLLESTAAEFIEYFNTYVLGAFELTRLA
ncbi:MAG: SDR family NAD(P)-dependent oxidoreductase, partial [Candidatus Binatia bacterium]